MKLRYKLAFLFLLLLCTLCTWFYHRVVYDLPQTYDEALLTGKRIRITTDHYRLGASWLRKNPDGNWVSYIEGNAIERGQLMGELHKDLIVQQEVAFVNELERQIPNPFYRKLLTLGIAWFNRNLDSYIPLEYQQEIAGISTHFSENYNHIGPKYNRLINYHAAHDIGHAVQNMRLVGCTAFGQWSTGDQADMISGRNFDFYVGEEFSKNKLIMLVNPDKGYKFLSVGWGGFCGVVSGMNEKGLGITLNSLKSDIPEKVGTPVSIIARDILQYAATVDEAIAIADKYDSFVSESFTISSAMDSTMVVIEKTPNQLDVYRPVDTTLIVTNHCQSPNLAFQEINLEHMKTSESVDRYARTEELLNEKNALTAEAVAEILRDQWSVGGADIGLSNPELINQLIAHHAVIFKNYQKQVWVSTYPYQINRFEAYDLDHFEMWGGLDFDGNPTIDTLAIAADQFMKSPEYQQFEDFKQLKNVVLQATLEATTLEPTLLKSFEESNPEYYETYRLMGNYYMANKQNQSAITAYQTALRKKIAYAEDSLFIIERIERLSQ